MTGPPDSPTELPAHPESDDPDNRAERTGVNWATVLVAVVVAAVLVTIIVLHLTGVVGPAAHS